MSATSPPLAQRRAIEDISSAVMQLLDGWGVSGEELCELLALPETFRSRRLRRLRAGDIGLPAEPQVLRRAGYLLRIDDALRTAYPLNPQMGRRWVRVPHRRLGRRAPLAVMLERGETGLIKVLAELDCTFSWDLTGSVPASPDAATGAGQRRD